jgi:Colicin D
MHLEVFLLMNQHTKGFNYKNPNHRRDNVLYTFKQLQHSYDRHKDAVGMTKNTNGKTLSEYREVIDQIVNDPKRVLIEGSFGNRTPAINTKVIITINKSL